MIKINDYNYKEYYKGKNLLSINQDSKTSKGTKKGKLTGILYLAPYKSAGKNLCVHATNCFIDCLYTAGRGAFDSIQAARIKKTEYFLKDRENFLQDLYKSIIKLIKKAEKLNLEPVVRLNGTSDLLFENIRFNYNGKHKTIFQAFKTVQFYDYSKFPMDKRNYNKLPGNYDLTFSLAETRENRIEALKALKNNIRVAAVYDHKQDLPEFQEITYNNKTYKFPVINGDDTDLRYLEPGGIIVGLKAKGRAKNSKTGFVLYNNTITIN